ncbi:MAG: hypothetical protein KDD28_36050, partial [Phaeodactylibacter sp.]|nr:hypothetical protein [Phaeodactylibacter sp.]
MIIRFDALGSARWFLSRSQLAMTSWLGSRQDFAGSPVATPRLERRSGTNNKQRTTNNEQQTTSWFPPALRNSGKYLKVSCKKVAQQYLPSYICSRFAGKQLMKKPVRIFLRKTCEVAKIDLHLHPLLK